MRYVRVPMKVKAKKEENKESKEATKPQGESAPDEISGDSSASELNEACWSVVTFENCAASNLTYEEAVEKLKKLEAEKISGLCIITDEAAQRMVNSK
jgi:hypothetical protein